ncbi:MAG: glutamine amidotransferase [Firmicutes bacterium]|nr:glutamine amidotransferase [Bacillota bacterium]
MKLRICHLYPEILNLYGDTGNIRILQQRSTWRGFQTEVDRVQPGQELDFSDYDLVFLGGGADFDQVLAAQDLEQKRGSLESAVQDGLVILAICGGYQLLGRYYKNQTGEIVPGIGLLDVYTEAGAKRMKGDVLVELDQGIRAEIDDVGARPGTLVGFENHSGRTYLGPTVRPLGRVLKGGGNNGEDRCEGAWCKNIFATYLHGPFLSKNPHFADLLISRALARRWPGTTLAPLDDRLEYQAHQVIKDRLTGFW